MRIAGWLAVIAIGILSLLPGSLRPVTGWSGLLEHFSAYLLTAIFFSQGYKCRIHPMMVGALLTAYAAILEFCQIWVPGRNAGLLDAAAGAIGSFAGCLLVMVIIPRMRDTSRISQGH